MYSVFEQRKIILQPENMNNYHLIKYTYAENIVSWNRFNRYQRHVFMSTVELKTQIHEYVEQLQDDNFIQAIYSMLDTYVTKQQDAIIGYDTKGNPKYASKMQKKYEEGIEEIKRGEGKSLEEMKAKYSKN